MTSFNLNYFCKGSTSKFSTLELGLQHMNVRGGIHTFSPLHGVICTRVYICTYTQSHQNIIQYCLMVFFLTYLYS